MERILREAYEWKVMIWVKVKIMEKQGRNFAPQ
jgi:hypothetical protein